MSLRVVPPQDRDAAQKVRDASRTSDPIDVGAVERDVDADGTQAALGADDELPAALAAFVLPQDELLWWDGRWHADLRLLGVVAGLLGAVLLFATVLAPSLWTRDNAGAIAALFAPLAAVIVRERTSRCTLAVTRRLLLGLNWRGRATRIAFEQIRSIRRAPLRGGVIVRAGEHSLFVPFDLQRPLFDALWSALDAKRRAAIDDRSASLAAAMRRSANRPGPRRLPS